MLLAIDTSAGSSVAVVARDGVALAERSVADTRRHAEVIGELIAECLRVSGTAVGSLSGVAVGMGPGPFTGLRVGIAAAQAFAFGAGLPLLRVVSHDAIALNYPEPILVVTDARRREVYWSAYDRPDAAGVPVRLDGPALARPDDLDRVVPHIDRCRRVDAQTVSAAAVGALAALLLDRGRAFAAAEPLYLRSPDVTLSAGPKRVTG